jgi:predicted DNA-binding transcriptional regulator AlpA
MARVGHSWGLHMPRIKNKKLGKPSVLPWSPDNPAVEPPRSAPGFVVPFDDQVITELEAARFCGFSRDTLRRRVRAGDGPKRLRLSAHRVAYRISDLKLWLTANTEAGS